MFGWISRLRLRIPKNSNLLDNFKVQSFKHYIFNKNLKNNSAIQKVTFILFNVNKKIIRFASQFSKRWFVFVPTRHTFLPNKEVKIDKKMLKNNKTSKWRASSDNSSPIFTNLWFNYLPVSYGIRTIIIQCKTSIMEGKKCSAASS